MTDPPVNSRILPYTTTAAYYLLTTFIAVEYIVVGSTAVCIVHKANALWFREVRP